MNFYISAVEQAFFRVQSAPKEGWFGQLTYRAEIYTYSSSPLTDKECSDLLAIGQFDDWHDD